MFDVSFGELMLIGVIALIVIGPQRLPKVARTVGHLIGRAQRYVNDVKSDIQREINLEEVNKVKAQMEEAARSVKSTVHDFGSTLNKPLDEAKQTLDEAKSTVGDFAQTVADPIEEARRAVKGTQPSTPASPPTSDMSDKTRVDNLTTVSDENVIPAANQDAVTSVTTANLPLPGLEPLADPAQAASKPSDVAKPASDGSTGTTRASS